jgi:N-acetylglucosamine kinase-like BadF-type ATPase
MSTVLAVDGGGFKTHLALVRDDGSLLAFARGPHSSPHQIGWTAASSSWSAHGEALEQAGLGRDGRPGRRTWGT